MRLTYAVLIAVIFAVALMLARDVSADIFELTEASATYSKYAHPNHTPYFPQEAKDGIALDVRNSVLHYGFFDANVHGISDDSQYRLIGLKFDVGAHIGRKLDIYYEHHSQHILDTPDYYGHWPVEDTINLKVYFYRR